VGDLFDLTGSVAVVTGGNSGIGLAMARGLASHGSSVAIWGTNESKNERAASGLRALGVHAEAFRCDVADESQVEANFAATLENFGKVDTCIVCAATTGRPSSLVDISIEEWQRLERVNSHGTFLTLRAAARHMVQREDGGSLIGVSSMAARNGEARAPHYAYSKSGMVAMMKSLAVDLGRHRVRANAILPGWTATDLTAFAVNDATFNDRVIRRVPLRRWGDPNEFAGIAVYLASKASSFHTGDEIVIDGGYLCS
jgi:NAD(P)-dependent dehydrogenase (short-subunit alcohol dehydrogenase family)